MIRRLKRACGIHFSTKALARNPGVHLRQTVRRFRSFGDLLDRLADERRITAVQVGANDSRDALGELIRSRPDRIERALLIEPQGRAFDRLARRYAGFGTVICLNAAIDRQAGERHLHTVRADAGARTGDGIASFDRAHVEKEIAARLPDLPRDRIAGLIATETVPVATLEGAAAEAGIARPDVLMVDTEGFDAAVVRMALDAGWLPSVLQYEHKHLSGAARRSLTRALRQRGYRLWADHADVWGVRNRPADTGAPPAA